MNARGMTLIEVMIALVLATVGLLGALAMVGSLYVGSSFNRNMTEAMTLAQTGIEQVNSRIVTLTSPSDGAVTEAGLDAYGATGGGPTNKFTRTTTWGLTSDGQRRSVAVAVSWTDGSGRSHNVTLSAERVP